MSFDSPGFIFYQYTNHISVDHVDIENGNGEAFLVQGGQRLLNLSERTHCGHF